MRIKCKYLSIQHVKSLQFSNFLLFACLAYEMIAIVVGAYELDNNQVSLTSKSINIFRDNSYSGNATKFDIFDSTPLTQIDTTKETRFIQKIHAWPMIGEEFGVTLYLDAIHIKKADNMIYATIAYDRDKRIKSEYYSSIMNIRAECSFGLFARLSWKSCEGSRGQGREVFDETPTDVSNSGCIIEHGSLEDELKVQLCSAA